MGTLEDLLAAVEALNRQGYVRDFRIKIGLVVDVATGAPIDIGAVRVDAALRFEGPDGEDGSNVYAITDTGTGHRGLLVDAFDTLDRECSAELFDRLRAARQSHRDGASSVASRYGLPKVFKTDFDQNPERYVLREGFPDFPKCPFGQSFSVLGFDTAAQAYVWLVTSILKDDRLVRVPYQGDFADP